ANLPMGNCHSRVDKCQLKFFPPIAMFLCNFVITPNFLKNLLWTGLKTSVKASVPVQKKSIRISSVKTMDMFLLVT
ncbi:MAG: hypothetical protein AAGK05_14935, partial [Pseudomonadota bacterium]